MNPEQTLIAIVDDDVGVRRALNRLVRSLGYETETFESGEAILDAVATRAPACAILDQHLPGRTGLETLKALSRLAKPVPVVVVTGLDEPGLRERCIAAGAVAYMPKPVAQSEIETAIATALLPLAT